MSQINGKIALAAEVVKKSKVPVQITKMLFKTLA